MKQDIAKIELGKRVLSGDMNLCGIEDQKNQNSFVEYGEEAREIAYGLMVKGYRRGERVLVITQEQDSVLSLLLGCELAHVEITELRRESLKERLLTTIGTGRVRAAFLTNESDYEYVKDICNRSELNIDLFLISDSDSLCDLRYLRMIGKSWEIKYKPLVDRAIREIKLNN